MVVKALEWVVNHANAQKPYRASVVLLSLGGELDQPLDESVRRVTQHGVHVVVAAGNDHGNSCQETPAATSEAITVGAIREGDHFESFSSYGKCVDIIAPGEDILGAWPDVGRRSSSAYLSGTSMAAPHVAGAALQILQQYPQASPLELKQMLACASTKGKVSFFSSVERSTPNQVVRAGRSYESYDAMNELFSDHRRVARSTASMRVLTHEMVALSSTSKGETMECQDLLDHLEKGRPKRDQLDKTLDKDASQVDTSFMYTLDENEDEDDAEWTAAASIGTSIGTQQKKVLKRSHAQRQAKLVPQ